MNSITIKDIAKLSGVGISTVSRAINNHPDINSETRLKVMKVIEEHNYIPNNSAINLKRTNSRTIAVLVKGISNSFFSDMIKVFEEGIQKKKYAFLLHKVDQNEDEVDVALGLIKEKRLSGIIFLGGYFSQNNEKLSKIDVPFVLSTVAFPEKYNALFASVAVDDMKESYKIVDYICKKGHKKIAIIAASSRDESIGKLRLDGYKKALKENCIEYDDNLCFHMRDDIEGYSMENGYSVMNKIIDSDVNKDITAVFAVSDSLAIGACRAIYDKGLSIPGDYSIAGFDGIEIGKYYNPILTTVRQPVDKIATETLTQLFNMIRHNGKIKNIIFDATIEKGESIKEIKKED